MDSLEGLLKVVLADQARKMKAKRKKLRKRKAKLTAPVGLNLSRGQQSRSASDDTMSETSATSETPPSLKSTSSSLPSSDVSMPSESPKEETANLTGPSCEDLVLEDFELLNVDGQAGKGGKKPGKGGKGAGKDAPPPKRGRVVLR